MIAVRYAFPVCTLANSGIYNPLILAIVFIVYPNVPICAERELNGASMLDWGYMHAYVIVQHAWLCILPCMACTIQAKEAAKLAHFDSTASGIYDIINACSSMNLERTQFSHQWGCCVTWTQMEGVINNHEEKENCIYLCKFQPTMGSVWKWIWKS